MMMPPVSSPARHPVSCLARPRPATVKHHMTGGPGHHPALTQALGRVDEAILKLANRLSQNTGVQDRLQSAVQESAKPCITFCQWMGLEMSKLHEELWTGFMHEAFDLVMCYRLLQTQQPAPPPPPPQAVQQPPVQPQPYQPSMYPWSVPPLPSPPFRQQLNPSWQPGPSTEFFGRPLPPTFWPSTLVGCQTTLTRQASPLDPQAAR